MTHDFTRLMQRMPVVLAALRIILSFIMDVVKYSCVLFIVLCSYIMDVVLDTDWHNIYTQMNSYRINLNKQFVYA